jgi:hypothetical protein
MKSRLRSRQILLPVAALLVAAPLCIACPGDDDVRVTVVSILATTKDNKVDPRLEGVAKKIKEKKPELTGFRVGTQNCESCVVGKSKEFKLVDNEKAVVIVKNGADPKNQVSLRVKVPCVGEICYTTCCGKYFPIITCYTTKKGECLIVAIMVKPCHGK